MKKTLLLLLALPLVLGSCMKQEDLYVGDEYVIDDRFMMEEAYVVPVQNGKVSVVTLGGDTLAITDVATTIAVPIGTTTTRAASVEVKFVDYADLPQFTAGSIIKTGDHLFWFEDSRKCDYDYNDLVLQVRTELIKVDDGFVDPKQANTYTIRVRGLALGSTKEIGFGFTDINGTDFDLTDNVRRDYFRGIQGFINTEAGKPYVKPIAADGTADEDTGSFIVKHKSYRDYKISAGFIEHYPIITSYTKTDGNRINFRYYIKVDGEKLYVGEYNKNMEGALPYGIRMPMRIVQDDTYYNYCYPLEKTHIRLAFPQFENWVRTGSPIDWNRKEKADPTYCYQFSETGMLTF